MSHCSWTLWGCFLALLSLRARCASVLPHSSRRTVLHSSEQRQQANVTAHLGSDAEPNCLQNTGGTCAVYDCAAWRGRTTCTSMRCFCAPGMCAGADGKCYDRPYETLLEGVRIRNVRWPTMYMYLRAWSSGVHVSEDRFTSASSFKLRQFPDGNILLSNNAYPRYVIHVYYEQKCDSSEHGGTHCRESWEPVANNIGGWGEMSAVTAALALETAPDGRSVMIRSVDYQDRYLYIPRMSWQVNTNSGDPGTGGYWVFDPPLPSKPRPFGGRRCSFDCGSTLRMSLDFMVIYLALQVLSAAPSLS
jgi:hypothetical protein